MYVKLYNKATSAPTVGTDLPVVIFPCPANATQVFEFGALGDKYTAGIGIAVTGAAAATDTSNAALGALIKMTYL